MKKTGDQLLTMISFLEKSIKQNKKERLILWGEMWDSRKECEKMEKKLSNLK